MTPAPRPWTCAEQRRFQERWGHTPLSALAKEHGRSTAALCTKAYRLSLLAFGDDTDKAPRVAALMTAGRPWDEIASLTGAAWETMARVSRLLAHHAREAGRAG